MSGCYIVEISTDNLCSCKIIFAFINVLF
jgi:hypothetical protein